LPAPLPGHATFCPAEAPQRDYRDGGHLPAQTLADVNYRLIAGAASQETNARQVAVAAALRVGLSPLSPWGGKLAAERSRVASRCAIRVPNRLGPVWNMGPPNAAYFPKCPIRVWRRCRAGRWAERASCAGKASRSTPNSAAIGGGMLFQSPGGFW